MHLDKYKSLRQTQTVVLGSKFMSITIYNQLLKQYYSAGLV